MSPISGFENLKDLILRDNENFFDRGRRFFGAYKS